MLILARLNASWSTPGRWRPRLRRRGNRPQVRAQSASTLRTAALPPAAAMLPYLLLGVMVKL